jgi:hypothetical protein
LFTVATDNLRIRQIIWAEYRVGTSKTQAILKINFIPEQMVGEFYQRVDSDNISLFD